MIDEDDMRNFSGNQTGMTFIGIILMLGILACFVTFGLRLFPLYNEYLGIKSSMQSVLNQPADKRKSIRDMRKLFLKSAGLNSVYYFNGNNVRDHVNLKRSKDGKKKYLHVEYENSNRLFKNIYLTVKTDQSMEIPGG